jgi:hypothetical protein
MDDDEAVDDGHGAMKRTINIADAMLDKNLLGATFGDPDPSNPDPWFTWRVAIKSAFGLGFISDKERETFAQIAGGRAPPTKRVRELWCLVGRRGGKSRMAALVCCFIACFIKHRLAPGELGAVLVLSRSADQAKVILDYTKAFLSCSPVLRQEIAAITQHEVRLKNGLSIIVRANSFRTTRGRTLVACVFDEAAYWKDENSAEPDVETYTSILPSLATVNGMLISISSAYRRVGMMYAKHRDYFGIDSDDTLVISGTTRQFNPTLDAGVIEAARKADPIAAMSEWDSEFRTDLSAFLDDELIDKATDHGRPLELPPQPGIFYRAYTDSSGGTGHDSYTLCIAHKEQERFVIDLVRGTKFGVPFDPNEVTLAYGMLCQEYRIGTVVGDNYAAQWVAGAWSKTGVSYVRSDIPKSQIYLEALPCFTRELVNLPDHPRLLRELRLLERRTHRSGKDSVDHPKNGRDDYANSVCGVLRVLSAYVGGYDVDIWNRAFGDAPDTSHQLNPKYADYASRPTSGPDQFGAVRLGDNGYFVPSIEKMWELVLAEAGRVGCTQADEERKPPANVFPQPPRSTQ